MGLRNDISGWLDVIGRDDAWRDRLHYAVAERPMPALEEFEIDSNKLSELPGAPWPGTLWECQLQPMGAQK